MRKLQFLHKQADSPRRFTLSLEVPTKQELITALLEVKPVKVNAGIGIVHPKDRFIKKVGRQVSQSSSENYDLYVSEVKVKPMVNGQHELHFKALLELGVEVILVVCPNSQTPFLIKGDLL